MISLETDVLIVGGGVAGLNAAITAAQAGARVVVADKGVIERSGNIAGGVDHFLAFLNTGPDWDTREAYLHCTWELSQGVADLQVVDAVYCTELPAIIARFAELGIELQKPDRTYYRTQSYGQPGPWWINFDGKKLKPKLGQAVRKAGCVILGRVMITDMLVNEGRAAGVVGFHIRSGETYQISAKSIIISNGGTNRLYVNPSGLYFNTWMCPVNTGDGVAMAYRAGATLANMEILRMTLVPKGFSAAGLNAMMGMGGKLVNSLGEEFMYRYDSQGNRAPRYMLVKGVLNEMREGRTPVYLDCRCLNAQDLEQLVTTLGFDKDTLPDFIAQKRVDLSKDLLEISVSEGIQGGPSELTGSGIKINEDCESSLPGLFAAGDCTDQCRALHMAFSSGIHAGQKAAEKALYSQPVLPEPRQVQELLQRITMPVRENRSVAWEEFEDAIKRVVTQGLGPVRSEAGMRKTMEQLEQLSSYSSDLQAGNYHELCRVHESLNMLLVAQIMACAALFRTESRFGIGHYRTDYPERNDAHWQGQVLLSFLNREPEVSFLPLREEY